MFTKLTVPKPLVLLILDGMGVAEPNKGNAVTLANTPNLDELWPNYPHTYLHASGEHVGLPKGVMGNSEVGHISLGAGKVMLQEIAKIDSEIKSGEIFQNKILKNAVEHVKNNQSRLHFIGCVSDGKVHSSIDHLFACLDFCNREGLKQEDVFVHAFTDGRDTPPKQASEHLGNLEAKCGSIGIGRIASVIGRYYAMDRDNRWERTKKAYDLLAHGTGNKVKNWRDAVKKSYENNITDEYFEPFVIIDEENSPIGAIKSGDSIINFNFRPDRAVQISKALIDSSFQGWDRKLIPNIFFAGFSNYEKGFVLNRTVDDNKNNGGESKMVHTLFQQEMRTSLSFPQNQIFPPARISEPLGKVISNSGLLQLRLAESEKFPHVTYFFNGREKLPFDGEDRLEIPSPRHVKTYDQKPEMSTYEIVSAFLDNLKKNIYDFILVNFALTDMVAHTGNLASSIKAVEIADECLGIIVKAVLERGGEIIITADHGNIEELINLQTNEIDTQHSTNPVPFLYVAQEHSNKELPLGTLADIAPTILSRLQIEKPASMTGRDLLK